MYSLLYKCYHIPEVKKWPSRTEGNASTVCVPYPDPILPNCSSSVVKEVVVPPHI